MDGMNADFAGAKICPAADTCQSSHQTPAIPSLSSFADFRVWGMPVEERRKPIHGGLAAAPCCRHPRQAYPTPFLISKLGIADQTPSNSCLSYLMLVPKSVKSARLNGFRLYRPSCPSFSSRRSHFRLLSSPMVSTMPISVSLVGPIPQKPRIFLSRLFKL